MNLAQLWDLGFWSFVMFIGVGIGWMLFIEPRIPSGELSVTLMIIAALVTAVAWFYRGVLRSRRERLAAQAQIEAAEAQYEDEIG